MKLNKKVAAAKPATKRKSSRDDSDDLPGVRKIADVKHSRSTVLYGRSGSGKTTLASTWPKPILYLDISDRGTESIADVEGIDAKEIASFEELEDTLLWLIRNPKKYKTVVLDTLSQLQEVLIVEVAENQPKKMRGAKDKRPGDFGTLTKGDWGAVGGKMKSIITDFRDLEMEVVFIAQDRVFGAEEDDDADQITPEVGPRLMPSVKSHLNASVSVIGHTFCRRKLIKKKDPKKPGKTKTTERTEYCLRLGPNSVYTTKIRKPRKIEVPDFIIDPTYEDVVEIIKGVE
jgi:hypothetical protein